MAKLRDACKYGKWAIVCTQCRRRATLNRGSVCTPCLNGDSIPDTAVREPITEAETPVDREFWELTKTEQWRHARLQMFGPNKKGMSPPSIKKLREINDEMFLDLEVG